MGMPMKLAGKTVNIMSGKQLKIQALPAGRDQTGNPKCVTASMRYRLQHAEIHEAKPLLSETWYLNP